MSVKIDQAFVNHFVVSAFGLPIAHENAPYTPVAQTAYVELRVLQNDITPLSLKDRDETDGVFRVVLRYPADGGAITAKTMADTIAAQFKIGQRITYAGQTVIITGRQRQPGLVLDAWYSIILDIQYRAFLERA